MRWIRILHALKLQTDRLILMWREKSKGIGKSREEDKNDNNNMKKETVEAEEHPNTKKYPGGGEQEGNNNKEGEGNNIEADI